MKKIFILLLTLLLVLPITVRADLGAPDTINFKAKPISPDGCDYYNYSGNELKVSGHLDGSKEIVIEFDEVRDGVLYLEFTDEKNYSHYVKSSDVVSLEDSISPDNKQVTQLEKPNEYKVIVDEVPIRKGLSESFKQVGTLKKGDIGTYKSEIGSHIYVETKNASGWVNMIGKKVLVKNNTAYIVVTTMKTDCGEIPPNTVIDDLWSATVWDGTSIIKYNGCEFEEYTFKSFSMYPLGGSKDLKATEEIPLYDNVESKKVIATIFKDDTVKLLANYPGVIWGGRTLYVEYNNQKGWIDGANEVYGTELSLYHDSDFYSETTPKKEEEEKVDDSKKEEKEQEKETFDDYEKENSEVDKPKIIKETKTTGKINTRSLIIMCVIASLALAITAVAFILLLNKIKNPQPVPVAVETKSTTVPCPNCGTMITGEFCENCGTSRAKEKKEDK